MNSCTTRGTSALRVKALGVAEAVGLRRLDEILLVQRPVAGRQPSLEEQLLPLLDHAVAAVVEHHDLDRQIVGRHGLELADVHADAGVAVDVDDQPAADCANCAPMAAGSPKPIVPMLPDVSHSRG